MKQLVITPNGWPCTLEECPPGHFLSGDSLCFKSEYRKDGKVEAYNEAGEAYHGQGEKVQPVTPQWEDLYVL